MISIKIGNSQTRFSSDMDAVDQLNKQLLGATPGTLFAGFKPTIAKPAGTKEFSGILENKPPVNPSAMPIDDKTAEVNRKLEAMLMSQFISEFIKHDAEIVFGDGVQGDFYKSLFADAIAEQMSGKGILGFTKVV